MWTSVPQMPVRITLIKTSLIPILGTSISSSQSPCSRLLFTSAFTYTTIANRGSRENRNSGQTASSLRGDHGIPDSRVCGAGRRLGIDVTLATDRCGRHGRSVGRRRPPGEIRPPHGEHAGGLGRHALRWRGGGGRRSGGSGGAGRGDVRRPVPSARDGARLPRQVPGAPTLRGGGYAHSLVLSCAADGDAGRCGGAGATTLACSSRWGSRPAAA